MVHNLVARPPPPLPRLGLPTFGHLENIDLGTIRHDDVAWPLVCSTGTEPLGTRDEARRIAANIAKLSGLKQGDAKAQRTFPIYLFGSTVFFAVLDINNFSTAFAEAVVGMVHLTGICSSCEQKSCEQRHDTCDSHILPSAYRKGENHNHVKRLIAIRGSYHSPREV